MIRNVIAVLRCFTADQPLQGVTDIAAQVGLHKSSVSRILATLEEEAIVERDAESRKYRLGLGLISVAGPMLANLDVRRLALPVLHDLATTTRETAALVVRSGAQAVTVEQVEAPQQIKHTAPLGTRYRTIASASVQVLIAHVPKPEVERMWHEGAFADEGLSLNSCLQTLEEARSRGYAVNYGRTSADEVGVAAPVRGHRGDVIAGVLIAAPCYRVPETSLGSLGAAVCSAAAQISARLGRADTV